MHRIKTVTIATLGALMRVLVALGARLAETGQTMTVAARANVA
jgi:hypothetical protein